MGDVFAAARANAINVEVIQVAQRREDAIVDKLVMAYTSGRMTPEIAWGCIAEIASLRHLLNDMNHAVREAIQESEKEFGRPN